MQMADTQTALSSALNGRKRAARVASELENRLMQIIAAVENSRKVCNGCDIQSSYSETFLKNAILSDASK